MVAAGTTIVTHRRSGSSLAARLHQRNRSGAREAGPEGEADRRIRTSGKTYWGTISFISSEAEFTPKQIQTKEERVKLVYRIKIDVDNRNHELKNNMPVDAEIVL